MKRILFHIPNKIDKNHASGSQIRPVKMLQAFQNIGYEVDVVMGSVAERRKQIKAIKKKIKAGEKYEFLYSESSTMPTALTESHHLPIAPLLDFNFFKYCKKNRIKIGLFYRDVYWIFDHYKQLVSLKKRFVSTFFYQFDLKNYNKLLDVLYLPSKEMAKYIPMKITPKVIALPPAVEARCVEDAVFDEINFVYVGGLSELYDLTLFVKNLQLYNLKLNLCTREQEWNKEEIRYSSYQDYLKVFHKKGEELADIYKKSTIAVYFIKPDILWDFAIGVKLFEYVAYKKPIIAVKGTAVGNFVAENNIGWAIEYTEESLRNLLDTLQENSEVIREKEKNIEKIIPLNTWEARAKQVQKDLS